MDGIFGVGIAELIIIILVILIIGGPQNAVKWSRDLGRMLRKLRDFIQQTMAQLENEVGDDGRELLKASRELGQNFNDVRRAASPQHLIGQATKLVDDSIKEADDSLKPSLNQTAQVLRQSANASPKPESKPETSANPTYQAWLPGAGDEADKADDGESTNGQYKAWLPKTKD